MANIQQDPLNQIEFLICDVSNLWKRAIIQELKEMDIRPNERRVLTAIARNPGATQVSIANALVIEPQNLSRLLQNIAPYIEKKSTARDKRVKGLFLNKKGEELVKKVGAAFGDIRPQLLADVDKNDLDTVAKALTQIKENLDRFIR